MLKLGGWGNRPWMEFEIDPLSGYYVKRRLKSYPTSMRGCAGWGQEIKVSGLGTVLCSVFVHEGEIYMRIGRVSWNLFEPGLQLEHREGLFHCELIVLDGSGKRTVFRYRRNDTLLAILDPAYDDLDFDLANLPYGLLSLSRRNKEEREELIKKLAAATTTQEGAQHDGPASGGPGGSLDR